MDEIKVVDFLEKTDTKGFIFPDPDKCKAHVFAACEGLPEWLRILVAMIAWSYASAVKESWVSAWSYKMEHFVALIEVLRTYVLYYSLVSSGERKKIASVLLPLILLQPARTKNDREPKIYPEGLKELGGLIKFLDPKVKFPKTHWDYVLKVA